MASTVIVARNNERVSTPFVASSGSSIDLTCPQCPYEQAEALKPLQALRRKIHIFLEKPSSSPNANRFNVFIMVLIFASTLAFILESYRELEDWSGFFVVEVVVSSVFTAEYLARLFACRSKLKFAVAPLNIVDLLAIVPFYVELVMGSGGGPEVLRVVRVVRLARVFRLFRSARLRVFIEVLEETFRRASDAFVFIMAMVCLAIVVFSSLMFFAERGSFDAERDAYFRPGEDEPSPFGNIVETFYWCVVTMTTVGYGDIFPVTALGKLVATLTMFASTMVLAFPIIIVGSHFESVYSEFRANAEARKAALTTNATDLLEFLRIHRADLLGKVAGISQFFMLLESPSEMDAVRFRGVVADLHALFAQFDALQGEHSLAAATKDARKLSASKSTAGARSDSESGSGSGARLGQYSVSIPGPASASCDRNTARPARIQVPVSPQNPGSTIQIQVGVASPMSVSRRV